MSVHTWNSGASTDMNSGLNYTPSGTMDSTWDLVWDNTSAINSTATATLTVNSITVAANYAGTWTGSSRTFNITGNVAFNHATISAVVNNSTIFNVGGNFSISKGLSSPNSVCNFTGTPTITFGAAQANFCNSVFTNGATIAGAFSVTFGRFKTSPNKTYTFVAGQTYTITTYTSDDWSGTAGNLVTFVSSIPGTGYTITPLVDVTASYISITDCINGSTTKHIDVSDGTSTRGLYCVNITWPVDIIYQDYGRADDTGDGLSMSTAKKTAQAARNMLSNAGDIIICRRATTEIPSATLTYPSLSNGTPSSPIKIMGMPRGTLAFTGTWVNNLNAIYSLNITAKPEQHIGRWVKNNTDGNDYLITDIIEQVAYTGRTNGGFAVGDTIVGATSTASWVVLQDTDLGSNTGLLVVWKWATALGRLLYSNGENLQKAGQTRGVANGAGALCFCIDRPYPGSSAAGAAGTIEADEDYVWSQTLTSGNGADLLSTWTADAHDLPIINWNSGAFADIITRYWYQFCYLAWRNASSANGCFAEQITYPIHLQGCYFTQNSNSRPSINIAGGIGIFIRCVLDSNGVTQATGGGIVGSSGCKIVMYNSAIHHSGNSISHAGNAIVLFQNVNLGVEKEAVTYEIFNQGIGCKIVASDLSFGAASIIIGGHNTSNIANDIFAFLQIENYQKTLNSHKVYIQDIGTITKNDCGGEPIQRTGGSSSVAEFLLNTGTYAAQTKAPTGMSSVGWCPAYIEIKEWLSSTDILNAKNFKFYVQSVTDALTSSTFWLECEYIDVYTAQGYHKKIITSTNAVSARSNASDWTQYLETGNIQPAISGWIVIRIFDNMYSTSKKYVDPMYDGALRNPLWSLGSALPNPENVKPIPQMMSLA